MIVLQEVSHRPVKTLVAVVDTMCNIGGSVLAVQKKAKSQRA